MDQSGGYRRARFKSPKKKYVDFKTTQRPKSPSPKRKDYEKRAMTKVVVPDSSRCTYINPETNRRCKLKLGIYPQFCHIHTTTIENLYISQSSIKNAGNGLFAGPFGFKTGDIIGEYSMPWMKLKQKSIDKRSKNPNYSYVFCDNPKRGQKEEDVDCWDGLDARSTIVRNANDAHGSEFKNNAYFQPIKDKNKITHIYVVASKKIKGNQEIFIDYGPDYF